MLRYATWQAVSTKSQAAADKVSLKSQLEACRKAGDSRGYHHTQDYTVPGKTRTAWISLYQAEKNIPQLAAMLEDAARHEFDLLIVYDLNRFRDLMKQVFDALSDYGVQLLVLSDPREPVPPEDYTEERKNETALLVGVRGIISTNEINTLRRNYRDRMPMRVTAKQLHPGLGLPPYGYRKPIGHEFDSNAILEQVPEQVGVLLQIKDWFLAGISLTEIAKRLNDGRIPSPRGRSWWYSIVSYLLANPYYAGVVRFGVTKRIRDRREGTVIRRKGTNTVTATGKHKPIWTIKTHQRILEELESRGKAHPGIKTRQLSRLLHCWCGSVMWAQTTPAGEYWRCSSMQKKHAYIRNEEALTKVTDQIVHDLSHLDDLTLPQLEDPRPQLKKELDAYHQKRKRWMDLYEDGLLPKDDLLTRISDVDERIKRTAARLSKLDHDLTQAQTTRDSLHELAGAVDSLPAYYQNGPPAQVNADLRHVLHKATLNKDKTVTLDWK